MGGRTGCRSLSAALAVARRIKAAEPHLRLAGVEGYEGSVPGATPEQQERRIAEFVGFMGEVAGCCADEGLFSADPVILTAGGSAYFDMVTALPRQLGPHATQVVIRSGCYLTHDSDAYARAAARMRERTPADRRLLARACAMRSRCGPTCSRCPSRAWRSLPWASATCRTTCIFPTPESPCDPAAMRGRVALPQGCEVTALNDQHAYLRITEDADLAVGDMIGCAISHPCTTFDKWRFLPIVDDDYNVIDAVTTYF